MMMVSIQPSGAIRDYHCVFRAIVTGDFAEA